MNKKKKTDGGSVILHKSPSAQRGGTFYRIETESETNSGLLSDFVRDQGVFFVLEKAKKFPFKFATLYDAKGDIGKRWHVTFYIWNKIDSEIQRKRIYLSQKIKTKAARYREADKLIKEINRLLETGYVLGEKPIATQKSNTTYISLIQAFRWVQEARKGEIRSKTLSGYSTVLKSLEEYVKKNRLVRFPLEMVTREMCEDFMTYCRASRSLSNNTYNNNLVFLKRYFNYLVEKEKLKHNPASGMKPLPKTEPDVVSFPKPIREKLLLAYKEEHAGLFYFSQYIFYSLIRPGELRKLKVSNVLSNSIFIPGHVSKNRRSEHVLIVPGLKQLIEDLCVSDYPPSYYLIGKNGKPSKEMLPTNYFSNEHLAIRRKLLMDESYILYCWKHTGAVEMYKATKDLEFISRHCRHTSLDMTKKYLRGLGLMVDYEIMDKLPVLKL